MRKLKKEELIAYRNAIFDAVDESQRQRGDLLSADKISQDESRKIEKHEVMLSDLADDLNGLILEAVIADISQPGEKIVAITKDVKRAIKELESLNDFIGILAVMISMVTTIITAFSSGNPLTLVNILGQIEALI